MGQDTAPLETLVLGSPGMSLHSGFDTNAEKPQHYGSLVFVSSLLINW